MIQVPVMRSAHDGALTPLQMLEHGVPCIVPDRCAASDYVEEGVNGLLFRTGDLEDLERAMRQMAECPLRPEPRRVDNGEYLRNLLSLYGEVMSE